MPILMRKLLLQNIQRPVSQVVGTYAMDIQILECGRRVIPATTAIASYFEGVVEGRSLAA
jgi:hypothetical protein